MLQLPETDHGPVHYCDAPEVPSGTLYLRFLPEAAEQRYVQRTERQTILPFLFRKTVWMKMKIYILEG